MNLSGKIPAKVSNSYLIQIYKSHFLNSLLVNNVYLLGMKNNTIEHVSIVDKRSTENIDFNMVKWVLLMTRNIPNETILPRDKIMNVAVCDIGGNVFLIDGFKDYILDKQLNIHELVSVIPDNFTLIFTKNNMMVENSAAIL